MRLVLLTQYYPPEVGAPQGRLSHLAEHLVGAGHEVVVVTAMPNYPAGVVAPEWRGKVVGRERRAGVDVLRSWIRPAAGSSRVRQLLGYGSFAASATLTGPFRVGRADVVLWESPPQFLAPTAWLLAKRAPARRVMNVSDRWPRSAVDLGVLTNARLVRAFEALERWSYERSDLVTVQTEGIAEGVEASAPGTDVELWPNGVDLSLFTPAGRDPEVRRRHGIPDDAVVVGYAGNLGRAQALEQVAEAAALLADRDDIWFLVVGAGPCRDDLAAAVGRLALRRFVLAPPVPKVEVPALQAAWDLSVVPLADAPVFEGARPSKMFELLAMELPFVFCGRGEGADLARASGAARVVGAERPGELAEAVRALADAGPAARAELGAAGRRFVAERFDRAAIARRLAERLVELTAR